MVSGAVPGERRRRTPNLRIVCFSQVPQVTSMHSDLGGAEVSAFLEARRDARLLTGSWAIHWVAGLWGAGGVCHGVIGGKRINYNTAK